MAITSSGAYNQQALVATAQIQQTIAKNATYLKANLPKCQSVVEIAVETFNTKNEKYAQKVAAIELDYSTEKLKLNLSVYKKESLPPPTLLKMMPASTPPQIESPSESNQLISSDNEQSKSQTLISIEDVQSNLSLAAPTFQSLVPVESHIALCEMKSYKYCPQAHRVLSLLKETFKDGIPLPKNEQAGEYHFEVLTRDGADIQRLDISSRSSKDPRGYYVAVKVENRDNPSVDFKSHFDHLVQVARGKALPSLIDNKQPGLITSATAKYKEEKTEKITN